MKEKIKLAKGYAKVGGRAGFLAPEEVSDEKTRKELESYICIYRRGPFSIRRFSKNITGMYDVFMYSHDGRLIMAPSNILKEY